MQGLTPEPAVTNAAWQVCTPSQGTCMVLEQAGLIRVTHHLVGVCLGVSQGLMQLQRQACYKCPPGTHLPLQVTGSWFLRRITRRHCAVWGMLMCRHYIGAIQHRCSAGSRLVVEFMHLDVSQG